MVSGKLPPRKIVPRLGSGFGLQLALELGLGGGFSSGTIFLEPLKTILFFKKNTNFTDKLLQIS